jgi:hypothetical protein
MDNEREELATCPICNGQVKVECRIEDDGSKYHDDCRHYVIDCCVQMREKSNRILSCPREPEDDEDKKARAFLITTWNTRKREAEIAVEINSLKVELENANSQIERLKQGEPVTYIEPISKGCRLSGVITCMAYPISGHEQPLYASPQPVIACNNEHSQESNCPKCNQSWDDHDFGVPEPYCPSQEKSE